MEVSEVKKTDFETPGMDNIENAKKNDAEARALKLKKKLGELAKICPGGKISLTHYGLQSLEKKGGLAEYLQSKFLRDEVSYKKFIIQTSEETYEFENVVVEISSKNLKLYYDCSKMFVRVSRTLPGYSLNGMPLKSRFRLVVELPEMTKFSIVISEVQFG
ncbi:MAG: hypothetical protein ACI88L_000333 [Candidatus Paceibacteria bacterium]|jgi:hypothetical protein